MVGFGSVKTMGDTLRGDIGKVWDTLTGIDKELGNLSNTQNDHKNAINGLIEWKKSVEDWQKWISRVVYGAIIAAAIAWLFSQVK